MRHLLKAALKDPFILCTGDDRSDEEMYAALPKKPFLFMWEKGVKTLRISSSPLLKSESFQARSLQHFTKLKNSL